MKTERVRTRGGKAFEKPFVSFSEEGKAGNKDWELSTELGRQAIAQLSVGLMYKQVSSTRGGTGGVRAGRGGGSGGRRRVANGSAAADGHAATERGTSSGLGMSSIACHPKAGKG